MKQKIFTLMILLALTMLVGKLKADNETQVMVGTSYTYTLRNVSSAVNATAVVDYSGDNETITQNGTSYTIVGGTPTTVSFDILYGSEASPATSGIITVTITNTGANACSNSIELDITVLPMPTYTLDLDISAVTECQARTGADNQLADARGTESNSFTYTVNPALTNIPTGATYTITYNISLPTNLVLTSFNTAPAGGNISKTNSNSDTYTASFTTTTGAAQQTLTASLINITSQTITVVTTDGKSSTYHATLAVGGQDSHTATIRPVPAIGRFE